MTRLEQRGAAGIRVHGRGDRPADIVVGMVLANDPN
jgi:hypothetical protein